MPISDADFDMIIAKTHDHLKQALRRAKICFDARQQGNDILAERDRRVLKYYLELIDAESTIRCQMEADRAEDDNISWDKAVDGAVFYLNLRISGLVQA